MKILVLNGSPKEKSDTMVLTNAFLRGINKSGNHEITVLNIIEKRIYHYAGNDMNLTNYYDIYNQLFFDYYIKN